ncbi:hypothetical protein N7507_009899 [Penicillium longicatenatum]|nr:hypothetical protein N7507_009899 [Penicillium longicatenatum]
MTLKYLITGGTGGLGAHVLSYLSANVPASEYAASSSNEASRSQYEDRGIAFRVLNYDHPKILESALQDVENLFFVSSNTHDPQWRIRQHQNVVDAAKTVGVQHIWYTSLSFGGLESNSKANLMEGHLMTEEMLRKSGLNFTSIREGPYADAFPVWMGWYPNTSTVYLPSDGPMALTLQSELGEATARLLMRGGKDYNKKIVVLTAQKTLTFAGVVDVINRTTGRQVQVELVSPDEFVRLKTADDVGGKPEAFFRFVLSWYEAISSGDASFTHHLMAELLGREPTPADEAIRGLLIEDSDYEWHQNYANRG